MSSDAPARKPFVVALLSIVFASPLLERELGAQAIDHSQPPHPVQLVSLSTTAANAKIAELLRSALAEVSADTLPNVETAQQRALEALKRLEDFVVLPSANGQAWSRFLRLDELRQAIADPRAQRRLLAELEANMRQNYNGLEMREFVQLRSATRNLIDAAKFGTNPDGSLRTLAGRTDRLIDNLETTAPTSPEVAAEVARLVGYYAAIGVAKDERSQLLEFYSTDNINVLIHENFVNSILGRGVAQPRDVNECILGTRIVGTACMNGYVSIDILPMPTAASFTLDLNGMLTSRNRGFNRGVVLHSTGVSPVYASKQVIATPSSVGATDASVATNLRTTITAIQHKLRIVRKIAKRKAAEQKPQADAIARGRMQRRVASNYDEEVNEQLAEANAQLAKFNGPAPVLSRLNLAKPTFALASTDSSLIARMSAASDDQLAAPTTCPLPTPATYGMVMQLHQSAISNYLDGIFLDRTVRNSDLDNITRQFTDEVPAEILAEAAGEPWKLHFADYRPVEIDFSDGRIVLTMRFISIEGEKADINSPCSIAVTFVPRWGDGSLRLMREGEAEVTGGSSTVERSALRAKFNDTFKEEIVVPVSEMQSKFPRLAGLEIQELQIDQGWMQAVLK